MGAISHLQWHMDFDFINSLTLIYKKRQSYVKSGVVNGEEVMEEEALKSNLGVVSMNCVSVPRPVLELLCYHSFFMITDT